MTEPRITLLEGSGRTFAFVGLVVLRESRKYFLRVTSNPPTGSLRDFEAVNAWNHEVIHFIQSLSTNFLYSHSIAMIRYAFNVLRNYRDFLIHREQTTMFEVVARSLTKREEDVSVIDLLEGVAVVESFKLTDPRPTVQRFLSFRDHYFPGSGNSSYRISFNYLSKRIGADRTFNLLAPLSFIALQSDSPPRAFGTLVDDLLPDMPIEQLEYAGIAELFSLFGMDVRDHLFHKLPSTPSNLRHPILYDWIEHCIELLGISRLLEVSARPSLINTIGLSKSEVECLLPAVVAFSSVPGSKLVGHKYGLANSDPELVALVIHTAALIGAVKRLTLLRETKNLPQFCPHGDECPHHASALCFRYFSPPSIEQGREDCGFARFFEHETGFKPNEAWSRLRSA